MTETLSDFVSDFNSKIDELKAKVLIAINKSTLIPDWSNVFVVNSLSNYEVTANGYIVILSNDVTDMTLTINGQQFNNINNPNFVIIPVKDGDIINTNSVLDNIYFLPVTKSGLESFE